MEQNDITHQYVTRLQAAFPALAIERARLRTGEGQFNDILVVNDALIFRFPRTIHVAATFAQEVELLHHLQGRFSLPIPNPTYLAYNTDSSISIMGYAMIPGQPFLNEELDLITSDSALNSMACQLAGFLRELHTLPTNDLAAILPPADQVGEWQGYFDQFREKLYPFMRPDACEQVTALLNELLGELRANPPQPTLCHGDFGGSNMLYDPQTLSISGVIDWSFCGLGDPAGDIASFSCFGEAFIQRGLAIYPEMADMLPRARLYRGTFALLQALYALRDGNQEDFADGIEAYV